MRYVDPINGVARAARVRLFHSAQNLREGPNGPSNYNSGDGFWPVFADWLYIYGPDLLTLDRLSTPIHGADSALAVCPGFVLRLNGNEWKAGEGDGWRRDSNRVCCVGSLHANGVIGNFGELNPGSVDSLAYELNSGLYAVKREHRRGLMICGAHGEASTSPPWVTGGVSQVSHVFDSTPSPQYARRPLDDCATTPFGHNLLSEVWLEVDIADGTPSSERILAVADGQQPTTRLAVSFRAEDSKYFATVVLSNDARFFLAFGRGGYASPSESYTLPSNSPLLRFASVACLSVELPAWLAARSEAASLGGNMSIIAGGVENCQPSAMVATKWPIDSADKCLVSFTSDTIQSSIPQDASFDNPQFKFLNCDSVISLGSESSRLGVVETATNTKTRTFRKPAANDEGVLAEEEISYVEIKPRRLGWMRAPVDDEDVSFPVALASQQGVFRFAGKNITGTGVEFVPLSSSSFSGTVHGDALTQDTDPSVNTAAPSPIASRWDTIQPGQQREEDLSGKYVSNGVTSYRDVSPADTQRRLYESDSYQFPDSNGAPALRASYAPGATYDERGYVCGALANYIRRGIGVGRVYSGAPLIVSPTFSYFGSGYRFSDLEDRHPARWQGPDSPLIYLVGGSQLQPFLSEMFLGTQTGYSQQAIDVRPSLAGKEFVCEETSAFGIPLQSGLFHFKGEGDSFEKTATIAVKGLIERTRHSMTRVSNPGFVPYYDVITTKTREAWDGSISHRVSVKTPLVEIYVKWSVALQFPGAYRIREPYPKTIDGVNVDDQRGAVDRGGFVKTGEIGDVKPILVASVWARATMEFNVLSNYSVPEFIGNSGEYTHKIGYYTADRLPGFTPYASDLDGAWLHCSYNYPWLKNGDVISSYLNLQPIGTFPFNRVQTQQLLDGETVEPTYWHLEDAGSALESQPVTIPWHNDTFGTYKLKFRLVTE